MSRRNVPARSRRCLSLLLAIAALWSVPMTAARADSSQTFKDWAVACDNTRHCEAVGFQAIDNDPAVSLWLSRDAGPGTPVVAKLSVQLEGGGDVKAPLRLVAGKAAPIDVRDGQPIAGDAFARLLPALLDAETAQVTAGKERFTLSLGGLKAALLKMDDVQGRLGTPGALLRKGARAESTVPPALPAPRLQAAAPVANRPGDAALLRTLLKKIAPDCGAGEGDTYKPSVDNTSLHRVSATQVILVSQCQDGYNAEDDVFVADDKTPYAVRAADFTQRGPNANGDEGAGLANARFDGQTLTTMAKGRGIADCGSMASWVWNGKAFVLAAASEEPLCRGFAAADVALRTFTTAR